MQEKIKKLENTLVPLEGKRVAIVCDWIKDW